MNRTAVVELVDALRRIPGVRSAAAKESGPSSGGPSCAWSVTFVCTGDELGREAAELVRICVQEASRVQIRELSGGRGGTTFALRGLLDSKPDELAAALHAVGRRQFEQLRNF